MILSIFYCALKHRTDSWEVDGALVNGHVISFSFKWIYSQISDHTRLSLQIRDLNSDHGDGGLVNLLNFPFMLLV